MNHKNQTVKKNLQAGYTLVEAMVYLVLAVFVITYAVKSMNAMTKSYTKHRGVSAVQLQGRDAINIMARQIAGAGFKYILKFDPQIDGDGDTIPGSFYTMGPIDGAGLPDDKYAQVLPFEEEWNGAILGTSLDMNKANRWMDSSNIILDLTDNGSNGMLQEFRFRKLVPNEDQDSITSVVDIEYRFQDSLLLQISDTGWNESKTGTSDDDGTWWQSLGSTGSDTLELLSGVTALQYAFSEDGITWHATLDKVALQPRNVKLVKVGLVVATRRNISSGEHRSFTFGAGYGNHTSADVVVFSPADSSNGDELRLHRFYEQIIEVPNNGVY